MGRFFKIKIKSLGSALKKRRRCLGLFLCLNAGLLGMPAIYIALFTPPSSNIELPSIRELQQSKYNIYVANWGFHTAILVEQPPGWQLGPNNHPQARYVEYGWGDKRFFMFSDTSIPATLAAGVLPTDSVVYLRGRETLPTEKNNVRQLYHRQVTPQQLHRLITVLEQSFQRTADGERVEPYPPVSAFVGQFYPGREFYVIWSDCNAWTVSNLHDIDVAQSPFFIIFSEQVGPSLQGFQLIQGSE